MTAKECGHDNDDDDQSNLFGRLVAALLAFIILILLTILIIWLILRPTKPHFILLDATVYTFNATSPNLLTSNLQVTLSSRNPNNRIGIYYDELHVYATYRGQQITFPTFLPAEYQGHKEVNVWSPFLVGNEVAVGPYDVAVELGQDLVAGTVLINIKVDGRVRWKVGEFISGRYHLNVNCPAFIWFGGEKNSSSDGIGVGPAINKYQVVQNCHVDV